MNNILTEILKEGRKKNFFDKYAKIVTLNRMKILGCDEAGDTEGSETVL